MQYYIGLAMFIGLKILFNISYQIIGKMSYFLYYFLFKFGLILPIHHKDTYLQSVSYVLHSFSS